MMYGMLVDVDILENKSGIMKIDVPIVLLDQCRDDERCGENGTRPGP